MVITKPFKGFGAIFFAEGCAGLTRNGMCKISLLSILNNRKNTNGSKVFLNSYKSSILFDNQISELYQNKPVVAS